MEDDNNTASKLIETKEIIRKRKQKIELNKSLNVQGYYDKEDKALLDYITNLQQEKEDYKSRIEKTVEYIKKMDTQLEVYGDYDILSDNKNDLLNILNGKE